MVQWQGDACVPGISAVFLLRVLAAMLVRFPFVVLGAPSGDGSEHFDDRLVKLPEKLVTGPASGARGYGLVERCVAASAFRADSSEGPVRSLACARRSRRQTAHAPDFAQRER